MPSRSPSNLTAQLNEGDDDSGAIVGRGRGVHAELTHAGCCLFQWSLTGCGKLGEGVARKKEDVVLSLQEARVVRSYELSEQCVLD